MHQGDRITPYRRSYPAEFAVLWSKFAILSPHWKKETKTRHLQFPCAQRFAVPRRVVSQRVVRRIDPGAHKVHTEEPILANARYTARRLAADGSPGWLRGWLLVTEQRTEAMNQKAVSGERRWLNAMNTTRVRR